MKQKESPVKTKGKIVSTILIPVYETAEELQANVTDAVILEKFNRMNAIDLQGAERNKFAEGKMGKKARRDIAWNLVITPHPEKLLEFATNAAALEAYLESPEVQKLVDAHIAGQTEEQAQ